MFFLHLYGQRLHNNNTEAHLTSRTQTSNNHNYWRLNYFSKLPIGAISAFGDYLVVHAEACCCLVGAVRCVAPVECV